MHSFEAGLSMTLQPEPGGTGNSDAIEVLSQSDKSWEDAAQVAVTDAAKSLRGIKSIYLKQLEAMVENNKVTRYRINAKTSFMVEGTQ
jgi:flavin-binding protein dodecin